MWLIKPGKQSSARPGASMSVGLEFI
jgi:hypothetical protein